MDTLDFVRDWMDRFEKKIDTIVGDVNEIKLKVNDVENDVANLRREMKTHMRDEVRITKKAGALLVAAFGIISALSVGAIIVFAPKVLIALAALTG